MVSENPKYATEDSTVSENTNHPLVDQLRLIVKLELVDCRDPGRMLVSPVRMSIRAIASWCGPREWVRQ